ncbi:MAG: Rpn family recombination-promoting nuclease/putative transposase [Bacteroidota bacterium]
MIDSSKKLIRFDWAIKSLLRDKANFDVLEGFLAALLEDESIQILELLGEEGQQTDEDEKFNRLDILVKDHKDRRIIIEVQTTRESDYLERLLFGTSKSIVDNISIGKKYKDIHKIISISILFFNLGRGEDYLYHGTTTFIGMNDKKPLIIKRKEEKVINGQKVIQFNDRNIFPEYYLIRVEKYKNIVRKKIDEWIYLIKNNTVKEGSTAKNIDKAVEKLAYINMSEAEKERYQQFLINLHREEDILDTARNEGEQIGFKKAAHKIQEAEDKAKQAEDKSIIAMMQNTDLTDEAIANILGLPLERIQQIRSTT